MTISTEDLSRMGFKQVVNHPEYMRWIFGESTDEPHFMSYSISENLEMFEIFGLELLEVPNAVQIEKIFLAWTMKLKGKSLW